MKAQLKGGAGKKTSSFALLTMQELASEGREDGPPRTNRLKSVVMRHIGGRALVEMLKPRVEPKEPDERSSPQDDYSSHISDFESHSTKSEFALHSHSAAHSRKTDAASKSSLDLRHHHQAGLMFGRRNEGALARTTSPCQRRCTWLWVSLRM
mmetsp:Transcript_3838/g.8334  ORF Transcript_3838/g.8334 Transcript_3838/m.8334 type:complete len:153 (+) Transcript_3838:2-460(+)